MIRAVQISSNMVPPTIAQQVFVIGSGIAGGLAGFILASKLSGVKEVPVSLVVVTTVVSALFTIGAGLYLADKASKQQVIA